ncbi:PepSY domain-containing protein [Pedobacter sp. HMWF019]|uniref:PepSY-associated TM helix domain-containing protein n=1 Tax=Pedobacter sp. HMWF019 TaxID=2056856 RepID=UPI000D371585|nr:PepSY-associated TM helix domain-containing protein [Pedobacter sp. HMWF019]PTS97732.1 PepSY domain-containing protein [Pedobacter sp. HMWF019]
MLHSNFKNAIRLLHLWLGLISGLVVFVLGLTGSIYAFSDELKELCYKQRLYVDTVPEASRLPLNQLVRIAEQAMGKDRKISRAELSQKNDRTYMFRAMKLNRKAFGYWRYYVYYDKVYLNPYTGKVVYIENAKNEFFTIILALHMNLLLGDQVGHFIVRWAVVCFVLLSISGIILWWPKKWKLKQLKKSFRIKWKAKFKRLNYDLHNVAGFYAFLVLILIALTGLMWSFNLTTEKRSKLQSDTTQQLTKMKDNIILQQALQRSPETAYFLYNFPAAKSGTTDLSAYQSNTNLYDRVQYRFDQYSGKLLQQGPEFKDLTITAKIIALNYDLHTGSAVGLPGKFIAFLSSLIAASLPVTGLLIWLNKKNR